MHKVLKRALGIFAALAAIYIAFSVLKNARRHGGGRWVSADGTH